MEYVKKTFWMAVLFLVYSAHSLAAVRWMHPTFMLPKLVKLAKIEQGPGRLIADNEFNKKAIFARINRHLLPFLPESTEAFIKREKIRGILKRHEWDAENTGVNFLPSDKVMLMHPEAYPWWTTLGHSYNNLEDDSVAWYCPHHDWTHIVGPNGVNVRHVLVPCEASRTAIPVVTLLNKHIFRTSNAFTESILAVPSGKRR